MPARALPLCAHGAALIQIAFTPGRARAHLCNLGNILPRAEGGLRRRLSFSYGALRSFGLFILEFFRISTMDREDLLSRFDFEGLSELNRAYRRRRGVVIVTSHIGNWEAGALALSYMGYPLQVVAGTQFSRSLSPHVKELKSRAGVGVISPGPGEYRRLVDALRANEAIALVVDGDTFERGLEVPFFRGKLRAPAGPARLAAITGASVVSTHVVRTAPMRFSMAFKTLWEDGPEAERSYPVREAPPPGAAAGLMSQEDPGFVSGLTKAIMRDQERVIGENPGQWCVFRRLWPGPGREGNMDG